MSTRTTLSILFGLLCFLTFTFWYMSFYQKPTVLPDQLSPTASGNSVIDVMVLYNGAANDLYNQDAQTRVHHLFDVSNKIYEDSGIGISLRLVHLEKVSYEAGYDSQTAIKHVTEQSHPAFDRVPALRVEHGADLVVLMRPHADDGYCGLAWIGGFGTEGDFSGTNEKDFGFSHVSIDCNTYVLAHELGHNMGLNHSRKQDSEGGTFDHALGYGIENDFVTVMAYSGSFNASKMKVFSNPQLQCGSGPCGIDKSQPAGADAASVLNIVGPQVADYLDTTSNMPVEWASGPLDVDGNGTADLVLQHTSGDWSLGKMNGAEVTAIHELQLDKDPSWQVVGREDYDGDGIADILTRNEFSGEWRTFLMDGETVKREGQPTMTANLDWQPAGTGDFDGDGKGDVLVRNKDGRWYLYFLDATNVSSTARPKLPSDPDIRVASTGDFNGDGKTDVLTRGIDGEWQLYHMDGKHILAQQAIAMKKSLDWQVVGVGDFDGNEQDDLLLRYKNGDWLVYRFDDFNVQAPAFLDVTPDLDWGLASTGDFDADGDTDILLRSQVFGTWRLYSLDENKVEDTHQVALTTDLDWDLSRGS